MNLPTRAGVVVGVYLGVHLLFAIWQPLSLWGVDLRGYFSLPAQIAFAVLSLGLLVPAGRRTLLSLLARFSRTALSLSSNRIWIPIATAALAVGLFVVFRSATHLLGDGYLYIRELDDSIWQHGPRTDRAPLTFFLIRQLHHVGLWQDGETTYRMYSIISGAFFVLTTLWVCGRMGKTRLESTVLLGSLWTVGLVQVFFGYVENYAFHLVVLIVYLYTAFVSTEKNATPWLAAIVLGVLLPLHFAYIFLLPSLFVLTFLCSPAARSLRDVKTWIGAVALSAGALALGTLILLAIGFDPVTFFVKNQGSHLLPLLDEPNYRQHYRMFSLNHALDLVNLLLLVAPAAVLVPLIVGRRRPRRFPLFLIVTAGAGFLFAFLANPEIGIFRDWDVLSLGALPLVLAAGLILLDAIPDSRQLAGTAILIFGAALLNTAAWVGVNADPDRSTARFEHLLKTAPLSAHALSYGWESLGSLYFQQGKNEAATNAYNQAAGATSGNPRHWLSLGSIQLKAGNFDQAMEHYQKALSIAPDRGDVHRRIGELYLQKQDLVAAETSLKHAIELAPLDADAYVLLGEVYMKRQQFRQAKPVYERAISLNPRSVEAHSNLASALYGAGEFQPAIQSAEQALKLNPDQGNALYVIGACYWRTNQEEKGAEYLRRFLEVDPDNPNAEAVRKILTR